jgi:NTE family protein
MKQKIALVLSGGGARGIAHIGVIEELENQGYHITSIAGTSMGAVVGGTYAMGAMEAYKNWLYSLNRLKVFSLVDFNFGSQGMIKGEKLFNTLKTFIDDAHIEDFKIPYAAVAADIINKKEVVFTSGSIYEAIRASIAIPTVFTPVKYNDGLLVDGGIINNLPIDHVKRTPGDILVAVNVNAITPVEKPPVHEDVVQVKQAAYLKKINEFYSHFHKVKPADHEEKLGYFNVINKTLYFMTYHTAQLALQKHSPDVVINISHECCSAFDFYKAEEMVETGRYAATKALKAYKKEKR